jgi:biopolymer transport protein ExbD
MAYKPSMRRSGETADIELDIKPVMNLMVVLIPLLLAGVEMVKLSIVEIDLPPASAGPGQGDNERNPEKEKEKKLGLKIAITSDGISLATASAVMSGDQGEGPTVPIQADGQQNLDMLKEKLIELKKAIVEQNFKDQNTAIITAGKDIEYQVIINILDAIQSYTDDNGDIQPLFPQVNFGQVVI